MLYTSIVKKKPQAPLPAALRKLTPREKFPTCFMQCRTTVRHLWHPVGLLITAPFALQNRHFNYFAEAALDTVLARCSQTKTIHSKAVQIIDNYITTVRKQTM